MSISLIAAVQENDRGIGYNGKDLYALVPDRKRFQELTMGNIVGMGRPTWNAIGEKRRPLHGRDNFVFSKNMNFFAPGATVCNSLSETLIKIQKLTNQELFIIGGGNIYKQAIDYVSHLYITEIKGERVDGELITRDADTFFPKYKHFTEVSREPQVYTSEKSGKTFEFDFVFYKK